ncbi:MAG: hypothetical protein MZV63_13080 [Marinilabiliales bacterium]|nr:hypothetical protein [Marinilabiliales bacterium]
MIALVTLAGCAVGPDFRSPDMATPDHYTAAPLPAQTAGADPKPEQRSVLPLPKTFLASGGRSLAHLSLIR